jgi:dienelactone hydrolase
VGLHQLFKRNGVRSLGGVGIFLALGCGSSASPTANSNGTVTGSTKVESASVRGVDGQGLRGASEIITPPPRGDVGDTSGIVGHWFISRGGARLVLVVAQEGERLTGTLRREGNSGAAAPIDYVSWNAEEGQLRFRADEDGRLHSYAVDVVEGTMMGRYATSVGGSTSLGRWGAYSGHLMGWREESFNDDIAPRVFDIVIDDGRIARLRVDRSETDASGFTGELKVKGTTARGSDGELPAQPIVVRRWDGLQITFDVADETVTQRFAGSVRGRQIRGNMVADRSGQPISFTGTRSSVLGYGLREKTSEARREWQERVRRILYRLMMGGNPAPLGTEATVSERPLVPADQVAPDRDDNVAHWRQQYHLSDVVLDHTIPNPYGPDPLTRRSHGLLAVPTTPPPPGGYGLVLSLNGHGGSAHMQFQSDGIFWYGDAYARRGYVVLALDVSHRPLDQAGGLYSWPPDGDSPETGNHAHPPIAAPGLDSDWSDDGERAWDAMRGIDFLLTQRQVNPSKIIVTGLSLGAEVAQIVGALDTRVTTAIPSGSSPDLSFMMMHGNCPCWQWVHGDATEFLEMSDYLALNAPRNVILESGKVDYIYSSYASPFAVEKENAWRARIAYGDEAANFVHYLHSGAHQYRLGDISNESPDPLYIQVPERIAPPRARNRSVDWGVDGETVSLGQTVFDYLAR